AGLPGASRTSMKFRTAIPISTGIACNRRRAMNKRRVFRKAGIGGGGLLGLSWSVSDAGGRCRHRPPAVAALGLRHLAAAEIPRQPDGAVDDVPELGRNHRREKNFHAPGNRHLLAQDLLELVV